MNFLEHCFPVPSGSVFTVARSVVHLWQLQSTFTLFWPSYFFLDQGSLIFLGGIVSACLVYGWAAVLS